MRSNGVSRPAAALAIGAAVVLLAAPVDAGDGIDLELWHQELAAALGEELEDDHRPVPAFGLFPSFGGAVGPPNWYAYQGGLAVSFTDGRRFSLVLGYGIEGGPRADADVVTIGWGGVRPIPAASRQLGFHSKFLRYRRWDDDDRGVHHGLSVGTEHGVGFAALSFEVGAARAADDHWLVVAQLGVRLAYPMHFPIGRSKREPRE